MCKTFTQYLLSESQSSRDNEGNTNTEFIDTTESDSCSAAAGAGVSILFCACSVLSRGFSHQQLQKVQLQVQQGVQDEGLQAEVQSEEIDELTPIQPLLLLCCLLSKQYRFGVNKVLKREKFITDMEPTMTSVTQTDFLLYCYYG